MTCVCRCLDSVGYFGISHISIGRIAKNLWTNRKLTSFLLSNLVSNFTCSSEESTFLGQLLMLKPHHSYIFVSRLSTQVIHLKQDEIVYVNGKREDPPVMETASFSIRRQGLLLVRLSEDASNITL